MNFIKKYKLTIITIVLIFIAILMPGQDVPEVGIQGIDKIVHFTMFGVLTLCFYWEYIHSKGKAPQFMMTWLSLEAFAYLTEIMQLFANGRSYDMKDFIADSIGILLGLAFFKLLGK